MTIYSWLLLFRVKTSLNCSQSKYPTFHHLFNNLPGLKKISTNLPTMLRISQNFIKY